MSQTPEQTMTSLEKAVEKLKERLDLALKTTKERHQENPEGWDCLSDLGTVVNEATESLDNNGL